MKSLSKKTKLTLTVRKSAVLSARRYSREVGKSISSLFEEMFQNENLVKVKSEQQRAAERLLERLKHTKSVKASDVDDKTLLKKHVAQKFA